MNKKISYSELIKTFYLDPIYLQDSDEPLLFKVEIVKTADNRFRAILWRSEYYRLQPSFEEDASDEIIFVKDDHTLSDIDEVSSEHAMGVLNTVLHKISKKFLVTQ